MTSNRRGYAALLLCLSLVACAGLLGRSGDKIRFSHARHVSAQVGCLTCHEPVYDAHELRVTAGPKEQVCLNCHEEKKSSNQCSFCHSDPAKPRSYAPREPHLRMDHAKHIERTNEECARCHQKLSEPSQPLGAPTMDGCLSCHEHRDEYNAGRCQGCHLDLSRYPIKPVSMFTHLGNYVKEHPRAARASAATCAQCHEQNFCIDCHGRTVATKVELKFPEQTDRDFVHRNDYLTRHSIEAKADPASCLRCHAVNTCESCHARNNLTKNGADPRDPHPAGWSIPGSPVFHGDEARRDIASCASCHDQGPRSVCIDCHKVGGRGGNPHPPGWLLRHDNAEIRRNSMCLYCHL